MPSGMVKPRAGKQFVSNPLPIVSVEFVGAAPTKARGITARESIAKEGYFILSGVILATHPTCHSIYSV